MEIYTLYTLASGVLLKLFQYFANGNNQRNNKNSQEENICYLLKIFGFEKIKYFKCRNKLKYFSIRSYLSGYGTYLAISGCADLGQLGLNEMK